MQCIKPINMKKPNSSIASDRVVVPCGRCSACLRSRRESWTIRLFEEFKNHLYGYFVTMTYADEHLVYAIEPTLCKRDVQLFTKNLRRKLDF